jgi:hypothetical protein
MQTANATRAGARPAGSSRFPPVECGYRPATKIAEADHVFERLNTFEERYNFKLLGGVEPFEHRSSFGR